MKIRVYLESQKCEKLAKFSSALFGDNRYSIFGKLLPKIAEKIMQGEEREDLQVFVRERLTEEYVRVPEYFPWQAAESAEDDACKVMRLLDWIETVGVKKYLACNVKTSYVGSVELEGFVHLIWEDNNGAFHCAYIHAGKNKERSMSGRSIPTHALTDLRVQVAKHFLEESYPHITVHSVYLTAQNDEPKKLLPSFVVSNTKNSNVHSCVFSSYYKDDVFDAEESKRWLEKSIAFRSEKEDCSKCNYMSLCKVEPLSVIPSHTTVASGGYKLPSYTSSQQVVVNHKQGAMRVIACAGSGKTASLVGRVKELIDSGVPAPMILLISFSNKAVKEISERLDKILECEERPKVSTIHALANEFLKGYGKAFFGSVPELLDKNGKLRKIGNYLSVLPPIEGFNYESKSGEYGLYNTVLKRLEEIEENGVEAFRERNPKYGEGLYELWQIWQDTIKSGNYITFDDMISMANKLLDANPDILDLYQTIYQYIMVDEFQDISKDQYRFIDLLARAHHNLVVVGDDDQSIYSWRGGSKKYLLEFEKDYNAKSAVLNDNFRSTNSIVEAANKIIAHNENRIDKSVESKSGRTGNLPYVVRSVTADTFEKMIDFFHKKGYAYGDMAILTRTNSKLEELNRALKAPCILAKSYMRQDGLFLFVLSVLTLYEDRFNKEALLYLMSLYGFRDELLGKITDSRLNLWVLCEADASKRYDEPLRMAKEAFQFLDSKPSIENFIDYCSLVLLWEKSNSPSSMKEWVKDTNTASMEDFLKLCRSAIDFKEERRVDVLVGDNVTLITNHDAKGGEWPVVIVESSYEDKTEETRELFYVAVTRAKDELCVLESPEAKVSFLNEFDYQVFDLDNH